MDDDDDEKRIHIKNNIFSHPIASKNVLYLEDHHDDYIDIVRNLEFLYHQEEKDFNIFEELIPSE